MFPYTEKYTASESDIQNNNLEYKIHKQTPKCIRVAGTFSKTKNIKHYIFLFCIMYTFHYSYFVFFAFVCNFCNFVILVNDYPGE